MIDRYKQVDVTTASPTMLIVKLYEGALRNAAQARVHLEEGRIPERAVAIGKALAIVGELQSCLDFENGGEIAPNLDSLYRFVLDRLLEANLNGDVDAIDDAIRVLEELHEGWQQIAQNPGAVEVALP